MSAFKFITVTKLHILMSSMPARGKLGKITKDVCGYFAKYMEEKKKEVHGEWN